MIIPDKPLKDMTDAEYLAYLTARDLERENDPAWQLFASIGDGMAMLAERQNLKHMLEKVAAANAGDS